jgi:hypothetical protein
MHFSSPKILWSSAFRQKVLVTESFRLKAELQTCSLFLVEFKELMYDSSINRRQEAGGGRQG